MGQWPEPALAGLAEALRRGTPWREALNQLTQRAKLGDGSAEVTDDARSNWIWFADLARCERALHVEGGIGTLTTALSRHFAFVHYLDPARALADFARARFSEDGRGAPETSSRIPVQHS